MAKRFGRNQRRRAREAIQKLQEAVEHEQCLCRYLSGENGRLRDEIDCAKRIAGEMSILFPPGTTRVNGTPRHQISAASMGRLDMWEPTLAITDRATFKEIPLEVMLSRVSQDALREAVHIHVQFSGIEVGYAISELARMSVPPRDMVNIVSKQMAQMLAPKILKRPA